MKPAAAAVGKASLYKLRPAKAGEGKALNAIEMAAGELFRSIGMDDIADAPGTPAAQYEAFIRAECVTMACLANKPVAFLSWETQDGRNFIYEVSVHPDHQGQSLGAKLIETLEHPTLSCFIDVPWNKPYYERLGFEVVDPQALGPDHIAIAADERRRFQPWPRCIMALKSS